jgi:hypothetical protein
MLRAVKGVTGPILKGDDVSWPIQRPRGCEGRKLKKGESAQGPTGKIESRSRGVKPILCSKTMKLPVNVLLARALVARQAKDSQPDLLRRLCCAGAKRQSTGLETELWAAGQVAASGEDAVPKTFSCDRHETERVFASYHSCGQREGAGTTRQKQREEGTAAAGWYSPPRSRRRVSEVER